MLTHQFLPARDRNKKEYLQHVDTRSHPANCGLTLIPKLFPSPGFIHRRTKSAAFPCTMRTARSIDGPAPHIGTAPLTSRGFFFSKAAPETVGARPVIPGNSTPREQSLVRYNFSKNARPDLGA